MRAFSNDDLVKRIDDVAEAATEAPVVITRQGDQQFVLMSYEQYRKFDDNPRRAYAAGEAPPGMMPLIMAELDRLASGEGYDDDS